ncbi:MULTISPECIES: helix-turn-helix domain-containing protein [Legionella]|uniref:HTH-type transcriptional regulator n=1 Tax=Legionella drozanskii LLAP-1 TaxID=1212489 RepID=A0A0W0SMK7_9GAMM|nr:MULTISPECIES: S24 family peptidase [Legionella]KTC84542.1 HTH-type transcriptional regulator [Legionella drozanskii LLAP-1]PJE09556.1 MAG: hypothetical protein CK430_10920 [Legionella sp.]
MIRRKVKKIDFTVLGENITRLMNACGIDATELSQQTGLPCSTISRLRSNSCEFSPNISSLLPIAEYFCINLSQLIGEEPIKQDMYATFKPIKVRKLPIPILQSETILTYLDSMELGDNPLLNIDFPLSERAFAYLLRGNSMEPQFPDKTLLIIDPYIEEENLDHVLVLPAGKKIPLFRQILIDGEETYIRTLNPAFNEFVKLDDNTHKILGVMVQARMNFKEVSMTSLQNDMDKKLKVSEKS